MGLQGVSWLLHVGIGVSVISIVVLWLLFCGLLCGCGDGTGVLIGVSVGAG